MQPDLSSETFWDHIEQLRRTVIQMLVVVIAGVMLSVSFYDQILALLTYPLGYLEVPTKLVILGPIEGFNTALKTCFWFSLAATSPLWSFLLLRFLAPALKEQERRLVLPFLLLSALFMSLGLGLAYCVTIPLANQYLFAFNSAIGENLWSLSHYLDYTVLLLLANAIAFEFAVIFLFLIHFGWLSENWLREKRRLMIVLIFIVSALLTPPDVLTQILLAIPLMGLYEVMILYASLKRKNHLM